MRSGRFSFPAGYRSTRADLSRLLVQINASLLEISQIQATLSQSMNTRAHVALPVAVCVLVLAATLRALPTTVAEFRSFDATADNPGWTHWSPRAEIAPIFSIDATGGRAGKGALKLETRGMGDIGAWQRQIAVQPGHTYRFTAWYRGEGFQNEKRSVMARLGWLGKDGRPLSRQVRPPEYATVVRRESGWSQVELVSQAPKEAVTLDVQLSLAFAPGAALWWDDIRLAEIAPPDDRAVRVMTVHYRPNVMGSAAESVETFCALVENAANQKPDIVCLPEGISIVGTRARFADVAEPIPGPSTQRLSRLAKSLRSYVVAGIYQRVEPLIYNTAVLLDREGNLVGRYRKTHLPNEEREKGLTPGDSYPIFETDFGKVGLMICWDARFPEPCRSMAQQGARLILLPTWGGDEILARARALENNVFFVSAGYDMKSLILNPEGKVLAEAKSDAPVVTTEIFPDRKIYQFWVGDMSTRTWMETRGNLPPR